MNSYAAIYTAAWLDYRLPGWVRRMVQSKEWRQSTALSIAVWLIGTFTVYELIERLGYGWQAKIVVALTMDGLMYLASKLGIWSKRRVTYRRSYGLWLTWWFGFFGINTALAWAMLVVSSVNTLAALRILAAIGITMNPVVYFFRDRIVFPDKAPSETAIE